MWHRWDLLRNRLKNAATSSDNLRRISSRSARSRGTHHITQVFPLCVFPVSNHETAEQHVKSIRRTTRKPDELAREQPLNHPVVDCLDRHNNLAAALK